MGANGFNIGADLRGIADAAERVVLCSPEV